MTGRRMVRGKGRVWPALVALLAGLAALGLLSGATAGAAARARPSSRPQLSAAAVLSSPAPAAGEAEEPAPCLHKSGYCVSSNPTISFELHSSGDTSGCKFDLSISWGDKRADTTATVSGGTDGTTYGPFSHTYRAAGPYAIAWTSTLMTNTGLNDCVSSSGADQFTLITAGIYRDFNSLSSVTQAARGGWGLIANVAGKACAKRAKGKCVTRACGAQSYVHPTGSDLAVERGLSIQASPYSPAWISYWTPAVPAVGVGLFEAGLRAGERAAAEIETVAGRVVRPSTPVYVGLDFEGSPAEISCGENVHPPHARKNGDKQCWDWDPGAPHRNCFLVDAAGWKEFALGWKAGILSGTTPLVLSPAVYVNKSEYRAEKVGSWDVPVIVALDPVRQTAFAGANIVGYAAYGDVHHPADCAAAKEDDFVQHVAGWHGISTIQFGRPTGNPKAPYENSIYCPPA
jgi:hypothetical protein